MDRDCREAYDRWVALAHDQTTEDAFAAGWELFQTESDNPTGSQTVESAEERKILYRFTRYKNEQKRQANSATA